MRALIVTVLPGGVDTERFHPIPRDTARAALGLRYSAGHMAERVLEAWRTLV